MTPITVPCPTCSATGTDTHEDRHTETRMDTCRTCGGERFIPARTGETPEASFRPLSTAHTATAGDGGEDLDARLKAAGMYTVPEMMGVTPFTRWTVHAGMTSVTFFEQWLSRRAAEFLRMKAAYELGDKDKSNDLYEWVLAHSAAFSEAHANLSAALSQAPAVQAPAGEVWRLRAALSELSDRIFHDAQVIERAGEWRTFITDVLAASPVPAQPNPAGPVGGEALREALEGILRAWESSPIGACSLPEHIRRWMELHLSPAMCGGRAALASSPTTGQETVATPRDGEPSCGSSKLPENWLAEAMARAERDVAAWSPGLRASFEATHGPLSVPRDGGVREALDAAVLALGAAVFALKDAGLAKPAKAALDAQNRLRTALSAPGSAGPGEWPKIIEAADTPADTGPADIALTCEWPCGRETTEFVSIQAARALGYRYPDEDATPSPAQEPGTGEQVVELLTAIAMDGETPHRIYKQIMSVCAILEGNPAHAQEPGTGDTGEEAEALAREIAAEKIGSADPTGARLPDDIWRQALPEARRCLGLDSHDRGEFASAAVCYALSHSQRWILDASNNKPITCRLWPWNPTDFKPTTPRRDLVKARALIDAALERLDRATPATTAETRGPAEGARPSLEPISIRDGGFYRNGSGEKVGPMHRIAGDAAQIWYARGRRGDWSEDGKALHAEPAENLVAEWDALPASTDREGGR